MHRQATSTTPSTRCALRQDSPPGRDPRGGSYVWDNRGRKILNGLSGLFVVQVGHGRRELAEVAAEQTAELMEQILRHTLSLAQGLV